MQKFDFMLNRLGLPREIVMQKMQFFGVDPARIVEIERNNVNPSAPPAPVTEQKADFAQSKQHFKQLKRELKQAKAEFKRQKKEWKNNKPKATVTHLETEEKSTQQPGSLVLKTWKVLNCGNTDWTDVTAVFVKGDRCLIEDNFEVLYIDNTPANGAAYVNLMINVPTVPGRYVVVYRLMMNGKRFGQKLRSVIIVPDNAQPQPQPVEAVAESEEDNDVGIIEDYVEEQKEPVESQPVPVPAVPVVDEVKAKKAKIEALKKEARAVRQELKALKKAAKKEKQQIKAKKANKVVPQPAPVAIVEDEKSRAVNDVVTFDNTGSEPVAEEPDVPVEPTFAYAEQLAALEAMGLDSDMAKAVLVSVDGDLARACDAFFN